MNIQIEIGFHLFWVIIIAMVVWAVGRNFYDK